MFYSVIKSCDIANGPGCRVSLFVSGCRRHCNGCFNSETWDFNFGEEFTVKQELQIAELLNHDYIAGLSILGGEPFEPENRYPVYHLVDFIRHTRPGKSVWAYSGFRYEELRKEPDAYNIIELLDVLVDGPFVEDLKDLKLQYCGSKNQRVIDVKSTLSNWKLMVHDQYDFDKPVIRWEG